ncbi:MAG: AtpZ/AtpI family protein [Planctomycetota bacterium]
MPRTPKLKTGFLSGTDASLVGLGMQVASEVAAGVLLGLGADHLLGTERRWLIVGSLVGVLVAMWTLIRTAMRLSRSSTRPTGLKPPLKPPLKHGPGPGGGAGS